MKRVRGGPAGLGDAVGGGSSHRVPTTGSGFSLLGSLSSAWTSVSSTATSLLPGHGTVQPAPPYPSFHQSSLADIVGGDPNGKCRACVLHWISLMSQQWNRNEIGPEAQSTVIEKLMGLAGREPHRFREIMSAQNDLLERLVYPHINPRTGKPYSDTTGENAELGIENRRHAMCERQRLTAEWLQGEHVSLVGSVMSVAGAGFGRLAEFLEEKTPRGAVRYGYFGLGGHAMGIVYVGGGEVVVFDANGAQDAFTEYASLKDLTAEVNNRRSQIFSAYGHEVLYLDVFAPPPFHVV